MTTRQWLLAYQVLSGLSDTLTGALLIFVPGLTLRLMRVHVPLDAYTMVSYVGVFVLSVGIACLYGATLVKQAGVTGKLEVVWILTTVTRGLVAGFVAAQIVGGHLEPAWSPVAATDGALAVFQLVGLRKGWLRDVAA